MGDEIRAAGVVIKRVDANWQKLKTALLTLRSGASYTKVGVLDNGKRADGIGNAELALIHEFGAPSANVPERSFIRSAFTAHRPEYQAALRELLAKVYQNQTTIEKVLGIVGAKMASDMKRGITEGEGIPPANTPEVFMRKLEKGRRGFNRNGLAPRPLVDTGQLLRSITWAVVIK